MAIEHTDISDSLRPEQYKGQSSLSLSGASLDDIRTVNQTNQLESGSVSVPNLHIGKHHDGLQYCSAGDSPRERESTRPQETREQALDRQIKECFGNAVFDHLKDWDWLVSHRQELRDGFRRAQDLGQDRLWDIARRMREQSTVEGRPLIFMRRLDGEGSRGSLIHKRYDILLRRGGIYSPDLLGWVHH